MGKRLDRVEDVMRGIVGAPRTDVIARLNALAAEDPRDPAPHLALALVASFARTDVSAIKEHLAAAKACLARVAPGADPELDFALALYAALQADAALVMAQSTAGGDLDAVTRLAQAARTASAALAKAGRGVPDSALAAVLVAGEGVHSRAAATGTRAWNSGMRALGKAATEGASADLAALFLHYGHRRVRNYSAAIRVAKVLEARNPASSLPKVALGSCLMRVGNLKAAIAKFEQAVKLAPDDPAVAIGLARALSAAGDHSRVTTALDRLKVEALPGNLVALHRELGEKVAVRARLLLNQ